ncbi:MAG: sulfide-dependent adenosine diphosphate thiazole synthase [Pirellulaceae bacterium]
MDRFEEVEISKAIVDTYHEALVDRFVSDAIIVGAGPSGLMAAIYLARAGFKVTVFEKRLSPGGGVWGGGIGMSKAVIQADAVSLLDEIGVSREFRGQGLYTVDAVELASALCLKAVQAGAALFNLLMVEDLCVREQRVAGVVVNRTTLGGQLPVDPIMFSSKAVLDATGHEAAVVESIRKRRLLNDSSIENSHGEGPMDAFSGEAFVVDHAGEVYPGLWVSGMSVCATYGGPRMGPIFGGMLLSGKRVAELMIPALRDVAEGG